jgi:hypothetical protein
MSREDEYRRRADELLKLAAGTDNMRDRSRFVGEASYWHDMAMAAHASADEPALDNDGAELRT